MDSIVKKPFARPLIEPTMDKSISANDTNGYLQSIHDKREKQTPTRSESTERAYLRRATSLIATIEAATGERTPSSIHQWLLVKNKTIRPSTLRLYRSALLFYMGSIDCGYSDEGELKSTMDLIREIRPTKTINAPAKTSSSKLKTIKEKQLLHLVVEMQASKFKWDAIAADVLLGTIVTGLRPIEWEGAQILPCDGNSKQEADEIILLVQNAKATNGRSCGDTRTLVIPNQAGAEFVLKTICHRDSQKACGISFGSFIKQTSRALARSWKKIYGSEPSASLYTARHQFSANAKNLYPRTVVALLLGHVSEETASVHYGKRRSGWCIYKDTEKDVDKPKFFFTPKNL